MSSLLLSKLTVNAEGDDLPFKVVKALESLNIVNGVSDNFGAVGSGEGFGEIFNGRFLVSVFLTENFKALMFDNGKKPAF